MGDFHVIGDFQQTRVIVHVLSDGLHVRPSETKSSYSNPTNDATYHYVDPIPLLSFLLQRLILYINHFLFYNIYTFPNTPTSLNVSIRTPINWIHTPAGRRPGFAVTWKTFPQISGNRNQIRTADFSFFFYRQEFVF
ncbi:unnamed protein product [Lactuca saligna]|uniref:Uncharacterized protein n=1 Tax=Lactuca saligna TaxID=75948 RepID=A0AA36A195_LACSI|nr:unnamed protein product [Lactuca saligna]